jgi:hypothetical protein
MAKVITNSGRNWLTRQISPGYAQDKLTKVAVGTGTSDPTDIQTSLDQQEYITSDGSSDASIDTTNNDGEVLVSIELVGGSTVSPGAEISEFGTFTENGVMFHREVRDQPKTISSGETVTFEFTINLEDIN